MRPGVAAIYANLALKTRELEYFARKQTTLVQILSPACRVANAAENEHLDAARILQDMADSQVSDVYKVIDARSIYIREALSRMCRKRSDRIDNLGGIQDGDGRGKDKEGMDDIIVIEDDEDEGEAMHANVDVYFGW